MLFKCMKIVFVLSLLGSLKTKTNLVELNFQDSKTSCMNLFEMVKC